MIITADAENEFMTHSLNKLGTGGGNHHTMKATREKPQTDPMQTDGFPSGIKNKVRTSSQH